MEDFMDLIFQPLKNFGQNLIDFVPNLLAMLIIFAGGLLLARLAKTGFLRVSRIIAFDPWCDRMGLTALIRKGDIWAKPSDLFGGIVYWLLAIIFLMVALSALKLEAVSDLSSQFFLYLPRAFSALLILVIGYLVAGFLSRAILIAAVNSGYHYAKILAESARLLLLVFILAMALEQLQIAPGIVIAAFSIIFGGIVLALAVAFGVGGIDAARRIIEKDSAEKKESEREIEHL